jgi:hypothetical protein
MKQLSCKNCCYKILFASSCINLLFLLTSPRFMKHYHQIVLAKDIVFLLLCSGKVHLSTSLLH